MRLPIPRPLPLVTLVVLFTQGASCLWPIPHSLSTGETPLLLSPDFIIQVQNSNVPVDLQEAISRTSSYLKTDQLARLVVGRGSQDTTRLSGALQLHSLHLSIAAGGRTSNISAEAILPPVLRREEYTLTIPSDGSAATLISNSTLGLFRGLTTFEQLWYTTSNRTYTLEAPIEIKDTPAFPYRGLMLDTARNFFPVSDIKRTLDAMSWAKLNQFHWHIVDSQSFPLQVPGFMEISQKGAYSSSSVYRPSDVEDIVAYAGARGIDVVMEIDTPGHTAIIHESHPEHVACFEASPRATFAYEPPAGQLRFASPNTTNFTSSLLAAIANMTPSSLFSTGGDELNQACYKNDAATTQALNSTHQNFTQALNTFINAIHTKIEALGKTPVVWEDLILKNNVNVRNDTVVMVRSSSSSAKQIVEKNLTFVHAASDYFYLDCGAGQWLGSDPSGNSWCDPFKTWQRSYTFDPFANINSTQKHLVLGGQQLLWTEQSGPENLDSILWPRAASSAEVFWTGAKLSDGTPRNVSSALPRLHDFRFRMVQRGVNAIPLQPMWCAIRPGECDLM